MAEGKIYTILHPEPSFRGVVSGIDFFNGRGTTSSRQAVVQAVKAASCTLEDPADDAEIRAIVGREAQADADAHEARGREEAKFQEHEADEHARGLGKIKG